MHSAPIQLICGCMFSGKTTELIRRARQIAGARRVQTLKPAIDTRYSDTDIVSHDGHRLEARTVRQSRDIPAAAADAEVVIIDEIHFFDDGLVSACRQLAERGTTVICSGLDLDMWGRPFAHVQQLREMAETTVMLGICARCGAKADHTHRKTPLRDRNLVGGDNDFEPRCSRCFRPPRDARPPGTVPGLADAGG